MTIEQRLRAAQKAAQKTPDEIDEGLLGVSRGIDRLIRDRADLLAALEAVLDRKAGSDFIEKHTRARARAVVQRVKAR